MFLSLPHDKDSPSQTASACLITEAIELPANITGPKATLTLYIQITRIAYTVSQPGEK